MKDPLDHTDKHSRRRAISDGGGSIAGVEDSDLFRAAGQNAERKGRRRAPIKVAFTPYPRLFTLAHAVAAVAAGVAESAYASDTPPTNNADPPINAARAAIPGARSQIAWAPKAPASGMNGMAGKKYR